MPLSPDRLPLLTAAIQTLIPPENHPGDTSARVLERFQLRLETDLAPQVPVLQRWLDGLQSEAFTLFSNFFTDLHDSTREELFDRIECDNMRTDWHLEEFNTTPTEFFNRLMDWLVEDLTALTQAKET